MIGKKKKLLWCFVGALLSALLALPLAAQVPHVTVKNKPDSPVQILTAGCEADSQSRFTCRVRYQVVGGEAVSTVGFRWKETFADGTSQTAYLSASDAGMPGKDGKDRPGQVKEVVSGLGSTARDGVNLALRKAEVEVDFVIFASGAVWGNTRSRGYQRTQGTIEGYEAARGHFRAIYERHGLDALLRELRILP